MFKEIERMRKKINKKQQFTNIRFENTFFIIVIIIIFIFI